MPTGSGITAGSAATVGVTAGAQVGVTAGAQVGVADGAAGGARDGAAVIATASITFLWRLSFMYLTLATDATVAPGPLATAAMDATERHPRVFTIRRADLLRRFRPSHAK
jgi:hypothetical protein